MHGESWTPDELNAALIKGEGLLLLDCRDVHQYKASHVTGALHVAIPSIPLRRMRKIGRLNVPLASLVSGDGDRERFTQCSSSHCIVVYEQRTAAAGGAGATSASDVTLVAVSQLLVAKPHDDGCRVALLQGNHALCDHALLYVRSPRSCAPPRCSVPA